MPQYNYKAVNKAGEKKNGILTAKDEGEVRMVLRAQSLRPISISKTSALNTDLGQLFGGGSIKTKEVLVFTRQLAVLIQSGVPLVQGLEIIADQMQPGAMKKTIQTIREKVTGGTFFWEAMKDEKKAFPEIYVQLVAAGEKSGALDVILNRLAKYLEEAEKLKAMVISAMTYPAIVFLIAGGVIMVMLGFVIPKFEEFLKTGGQELPLPTQIVVDASHFITKNFSFIIVGFVAVVYMSYAYLKTREGKKFFDYNVLKAPLFGPLLNKIAVARFARTMQTLLASGVNLLDALEICKKAAGNIAIEESIVKIKKEIEQGDKLSNVMSKIKIFPSMATQMVTVGENTGNIDKMLEKVADWYEEEARNLIGNMTKLIEPLMIVVLGGIVGGMLMAMYLPVFKMAGGGK